MRQIRGPYVDIATGGGNFVLDFRSLQVPMYGFDIILNPRLLDPDQPESDFFTQVRAEHTGFEPNTFAGAFANFSPLWSQSQRVPLVYQYVAEAHRILMPGGFLIVGPVHLQAMRRILNGVPFQVYEMGQIRRIDVPGMDGPAMYPYVVLEKATMDGSESVLDQVFGRARRALKRPGFGQSDAADDAAARREHRAAERDRETRIRRQRGTKHAVRPFW